MCNNPNGKVINIDLELAFIVFHHSYMEDMYDFRERTTIARTDNMSGIWWHWKGSTTYISPLSHLICPQALRQRYHRYMPCHDFFSRMENIISGYSSRSTDLTDSTLLSHMDTTHPQRLPLWICISPIALASTIASVLRQTTLSSYYPLADPQPPMVTRQCVTISAKVWPSTFYLSSTDIWCPY